MADGVGAAVPLRTQRPPSTAAGSASEELHDRALADACAAVKGDRVLYLGMNRGSADVEARALRSATRGNVDRVEERAEATFELGGISYDLSRDGDLRSFVGGLRLGAEATARLEDALRSVDGFARDELARLALFFSTAERGGPMPSRMVLSGHSGGREIFGDGGVVSFDAVQKIARVFPHAAGRVEDLHLSGCNTAGQARDVAVWRGAFPNLKTVWAYVGAAPSAASSDLTRWESVTRGRREALFPPRTQIVTWSSRGGLRDGSVSLTELRSQVREADARFSDFRSGRITVTSPHQGDVESDYAAYRNLETKPGASRNEQLEARGKAEALLRVRYWTGIRAELAARHGTAIRRACELLGLPPLDFRGLSRRAAVEHLASFRARAAETPLPADLASLGALLEAAEALDERIPAAWCHL